MARWRNLSQLSVVLGFACLSCGGTGSDADRTPAKSASETQDILLKNDAKDPGSLLTYDCNADKPAAGITLHMIEDWEAGAGAGWYTNNDKCETCQDATDLIVGSEVKGIVGAIDAGTLPAGNADQLEAALKDRSACTADCYFAQWPSYFAKPVPGDKIPGPPGHEDEGRCGSKYAFHVIAGPFSTWGGQLGMNLKPPNCVAGECPSESTEIPGGPWDGIAFWARVAPGSGQTMRMQVGESHTDNKYPLAATPPCKDNVGKNSANNTKEGCDAFGLFAVMNNDWQFITLPFNEMRQAGWGKKAPYFDIEHLSNLTFFYGQGTWDIWIDDIAYYKRSAE